MKKIILLTSLVILVFFKINAQEFGIGNFIFSSEQIDSIIETRKSNCAFMVKRIINLTKEISILKEDIILREKYLTEFPNDTFQIDFIKAQKDTLYKAEWQLKTFSDMKGSKISSKKTSIHNTEAMIEEDEEEEV